MRFPQASGAVSLPHSPSPARRAANEVVTSLPTGGAPKLMLTNAELLALFRSYEMKQAEIRAAKKVVEKLKQESSDICGKIIKGATRKTFRIQEKGQAERIYISMTHHGMYFFRQPSLHEGHVLTDDE